MADTRSPVVAIRGFSKTFGTTTVLSGVDLDLFAGEVHALVGQNGSGKSTLIKILSGFHAPDPGARLRIDGIETGLPLDGNRTFELGLRFLHQDLGLIDSMSVLENLAAGRFNTRRLGIIDWSAERRAARAGLARFSLEVDPDTKVSELSPVDRTVVGIVRVLRSADVRLLVLDEPTAYLPQEEVDRLFRAMRVAASHGAAVVFVTHRLSEVFSVSDTVSVLRDGYLQGTYASADVTTQHLVNEILGVRYVAQQRRSRRAPGSTFVLHVEDLAGGSVQGVSFGLLAGEILGITGLGGMGEEELPYLIYGSTPRRTGRVRLTQTDVDVDTPLEALANGMVLVPGDRLRQGSIPMATVAENLTLPTLTAYCWRGWLSHRRELRGAGEVLRRFNVNPPVPTLRMSKLSGGNQQKAIIGKWLQTEPGVLLLHEPTNGVDIGSRRHLFTLIREAADAGCGVLISSIEHEEIADLCDRVLVFNNGLVVDEITGDEVTKDRVITSCYFGSSGASGCERAGSETMERSV